MKRIIILLFLFLVSLSVIGQIKQDSRHIAYKKYKTNKSFKKDFKDFKLPSHLINPRALNFQKSSNVIKKRLDSLIVQERNDGISPWFNDLKEEYTYDTNENIILEIDFYWENTQWVESEKWEYTYNTNQYVATLINYEWDNNQWVPMEKIENTYDSTNKLITLLIYEWNNNQWVLSYKIENIYDGDGNITIETVSILDMGSIWIEYYKYEHTYINNQRTVLTAFEWNFITSQWDYDWKDEYTYDVNENLVTEIDYYWDSPLWIQYDKYEYTYDSNRNTTSEIKYEWNTNTSEWDESEKYEYNHDLAYTISDVIIPYWLYGNYDYVFYNMVTDFSFYTFTDPNWVEIEKSILYYSDYDSSLNVEDEILANSISIYPNPVTDLLTVNCETIHITKIEIYSILGKKIKEISSDFKSMQMDNLSKGIYIIRIRSENGLAIRKLIKQ